MKVKSYEVFVEALENGIKGGLNKCMDTDLAYLWVEDKNMIPATEKIQEYIMNELCQYFTWEDEYGSAEDASEEAGAKLLRSLENIEATLGVIAKHLIERRSVVFDPRGFTS